jgi:general secretion pathway protein G
LQALRSRPANVNNWQGPYLPQEIPNDPWGRPYLYRYPSEQGDEPEIISLGADGQPGGEDINTDIVSWKSY